MAELVGPRAIEDAAVKWVIELEGAVGRQPQDTRHKGAAADIESPPRVIEINVRHLCPFALWSGSPGRQIGRSLLLRLLRALCRHRTRVP